jgi:hypothetical protein
MESITQIKERLSLHTGEFVIHEITKNEDEPRGGWYWQALSIDAMVSRALNRWSKIWHVPKRYKSHDTLLRFGHWNEEDVKSHNHMRKYYEVELNRPEMAEKMYPAFKTIKHASVWAFFDSIGYNYKDKTAKSIDKLIHIETKQTL